MLGRRSPDNRIGQVRHGAALGRRLAVVGAVAGLSCGAMAATVAFSAPAGATTTTT